MRNLSILRLVPGVVFATVLMMPLWGSSVWARDNPAPVVDATGGGGSSLESRVVRLERLLENQTLIDLASRLNQLQNEVQSMRGELEEQAHTIETLQKRQRDIYLDVDKRLSKLEEAKGASAPQQSMGAFVPAPNTPVSSVPPNAAIPGSAVQSSSSSPTGSATMSTSTNAAGISKDERLAYERAFNFLKDGRYDLSVTAFRTFVKSYPNGAYTDNAQYWLGEANYVQRHFKEALAEFGKVVNNFPASPKRADALLKMGYTYQELGDLDNAKMSLNNVVQNYPNSTAAGLAKKRLQSLNQDQ